MNELNERKTHPFFKEIVVNYRFYSYHKEEKHQR